jgi:hypothetical protein
MKIKLTIVMTKIGADQTLYAPLFFRLPSSKAKMTLRNYSALQR